MRLKHKSTLAKGMVRPTYPVPGSNTNYPPSLEYGIVSRMGCCIHETLKSLLSLKLNSSTRQCRGGSSSINMPLSSEQYFLKRKSGTLRSSSGSTLQYPTPKQLYSDPAYEALGEMRFR